MPGFTILNEKVQKSISGQKIDLSDCDSSDLEAMKQNYDDFIMYIWMFLGDTRFNRLGYRTATDELSKKLFNFNN